MQRFRALFHSLFLLGLLLAGGPDRQVSAQEPPPIRSVVSRDFTIANEFLPGPTPTPIRSVISREFTVSNLFLPSSTPQPIRSVASREFTIGLSVADLTVSDILVTPQSGLPGRPATAIWSVTNVGGGTARGPWVDRVYVSSDLEIGRDELVGEVVYDGPEVKGGESYQDTLAFEFPAEAGQYWIVVETGYLGAFGEERFDNNLALDDVPILVDQPPSPDLVVAEITSPTGTLLAGSTAELTYRVENQSTNSTNVSTWSDSVFLTLSQRLSVSLSAEPYFLGAFGNSTVLLPGESYTQTVRFTLPEKILGEFFFCVYTDNRRTGSWRRGNPYDQIEENEGNNWGFSATVAIDITSSQPDLLAESLLFFREASSATQFSVSWEDANIGTGPTDIGTWTDRVFLSSNQNATISPSDELLGSVTRSGEPLLPGLRSPLRLDAILRADLSGMFFVKVEVDTGFAISEFGFEGNNVTVSTEPVDIGLSPSIDLDPTSLTPPDSGFPGHPIDVSWSVRNIGFPPLALAYGWQDAIYLSEDPEWDATIDPRLGIFSRSTGRDENGNTTLDDYEGFASVRLPDFLAAGNYYLVLVVDHGNHVFEGFDSPGVEDDGIKENNNVLVSGPFPVSRLSADLAIDVEFATESELSTAGGVDQEIRLAWRVTNTGDLVTPVSSWTDAVYLSDNELLDSADTRLVRKSRSFSLGPGETYLESATARVPSQPPGDYYLIISADDDQRVLELPPGELNNQVLSPFAITDEGVDLQVSGVRGPDTARSGEAIVVEWTVENAGALASQKNLWTDRVYLSVDGTLDSSDRLLGSRSHGDFLGPGEHYDEVASFPLPVDVRGTYQIIVQTDATSGLVEINEANNTRARAMTVDIELLPAPNLVVTEVRVDGDVVSGQTIRVTWTVENRGAGPTTSSRWRDSVFLSRDATLEPNSDLFLGSVERLEPLAPGARYTASAELDVALGTSGQFTVFVLTDRGASNFEDGALADNQLASVNPLDVSLPLPGDLVVRGVTIPAGGVVGNEAVFEWELENLAGEPIAGRWSDSLFLSADDEYDGSDLLIGRFTSVADTPIPAGSTRTFQATGTIPPAPSGDYRVLVRTNVLAQVHEIDLGNNLGVSTGSIGLSLPELLLDAEPLRLNLTPALDRHFTLTVPGARTVRVTLDHDATQSWTELYVAFERPAGPGDFDYRYSLVGEADQTVTIPETLDGTYFVLARAARGSATLEDNASLHAETIPFSLETVTPETIGDRGRVTITCRGSRFAADNIVSLTNTNGITIPARTVRFIDSTHLEATFLLESPPHGLYTGAVVRLGGESTSLQDAVTVEATTHPVLEAAQPDPPALRAGAAGGTMDFVVVNRGNVDAEYVFLLNAFTASPEREVVRLASSNGLTRDVERNDVLRESLLLRTLAPGETATLSMTLRAGKHTPGDLPIGQAAAVFTTEKFLEFHARAAESVRQSLLTAPSLLVEGTADTVLPFAQNERTWRGLWFSQLIAAGLVETIDVQEFVPAAPTVTGHARCIGRTQIRSTPSVVCSSMESLLCDEWTQRLIEVGTEATGVFASAPLGGDRRPIACRLDEFVSCTLCTFWPVKSSLDPNEKTGGEGAGDEGFVPAEGAIEYRIDFENEGTATAPASVVRIVDALDPGLNTASVRFGEIKVGGRVIETPLDAPVISQTVPLEGDEGLDLAISARVDAANDRVLWTFRTIDRATGAEPTDGRLGFLPPADGSDRSQGSVQFSVRPKPDVISRVEIRNEADIFFDANDQMTTTTVSHTIDADAPQSSVVANGEFTSEPVIPLTWGGFDPVDGSGLAGYTVFASEDGGPFVPVLSNTTKTFTLFEGEEGKTYSFYSQATDHAGNEESPPLTPDQIVTVTSSRPFRRGDVDDNGQITINDGIRLLGFLFLGGVELPCPDAGDADDLAGLELTDAVYILNWLFNGGPDPASPGPNQCGQDPTPDALGGCNAESCP